MIEQFIVIRRDKLPLWALPASLCGIAARMKSAHEQQHCVWTSTNYCSPPSKSMLSGRPETQDTKQTPYRMDQSRSDNFHHFIVKH